MSLTHCARVIIIGGHGKVALLTAPLLVAAGRSVTSVIRNADHRPDVAATGADPLVIDVESADVDALAALLTGHDAVVWSAGAGGGNPARTYAVDRDAAIRAIDATQRAGIDRFVMVSYFGSGIDDIPADNSFAPYSLAKAAADDHLRASALNWTILGPSRLTDEPASGLIDEDGASGTVSRADVAMVIAESIDQPATFGRTIRFNNGTRPIADILHRTP